MAAELYAAAGVGATDVFSVRDVAADAFIVKYAAFLKKSGKLPQPEWVDVVKTGSEYKFAPQHHTRFSNSTNHV
jgi:ribosomal protein S19E (S16A)